MNNTATRPRIRIELTTADKIVEAVSIVGVCLAIAGLATCWQSLPQSVPMHSNFAGKVDSWGPKATLILMPALSVLSYALLGIIGKFPQIFNYPVAITEENAERQYRIATDFLRYLKLIVVWTVVYANWAFIQVALGKARSIDPLFLIVTIGAMTVISITFIVRAYRAK